MVASRTSGVATATRALDIAEALVQQRGFNGFSYADVAQQLGVTNASLHYHFPAKADLGLALIQRYSDRFAEALKHIDARCEDVNEKLQAFVELYAEVLRRGRMCLCGMLASDFETLPEEMGEAVLGFFEDTEAWLAAVLEEGRGAGQLSFAVDASDAASTIVAGLEGAMLLARPHKEVARFDRMAAQLLGALRSE